MMSTLGTLTLQATYLLLPFVVAAALAGVVQRHDLWSGLKRPIDGGLTVRGRRLFGDHKTWRGATVTTVASSRRARPSQVLSVVRPTATATASVLATTPASKRSRKPICSATATTVKEAAGVPWGLRCVHMPAASKS